jgi:hypothetical protein
MASEEKIGMSALQTEHSFPRDEPKIRAGEIEDGDLALKVLHTHFEPYTKDEEKRVLRKIDFRLASLMLLVNGIQFVDKLVSIYSPFMHAPLTNFEDHISSRHLWPHH